jgi:hypothetical protein
MAPFFVLPQFDRWRDRPRQNGCVDETRPHGMANVGHAESSGVDVLPVVARKQREQDTGARDPS